jgi:transposase-like protein
LEKPRYPEEFKQAAVNLYLEGNSSIAVSRIMGIGKSTIWYWLKKHNEELPKIKESDTKIVEIDKFCTHIKKD